MANGSSAQGGFPGAVRLFRAFGVDVFLHWSWLLVAWFELQVRRSDYESPAWNVAEYLTLFAIVLVHEFGHALACRSVGGKADRILLWPFGGVAFVQPPPRPGAVLWSIAAGPLVNVALIPVTLGALFGTEILFPNATEDVHHYLFAVGFINIALLVFNMLPIYPLDGGQILQSILWFFVGFTRSLSIAASIGLVGAIAVVGLAVYQRDLWLIALAVLGASQCWRGIQTAKALTRQQNIPRRAGATCPACGEAPPKGPFWRCQCGEAFDTFATRHVCPKCSAPQPMTGCPRCRRFSPADAWETHDVGMSPTNH